MKKIALALCLLTVSAAVADGIALLEVPLSPWPLFAVFEALALILGVFVGLTYTALTKQLRQWAVGSAWLALGMPFLLLIPYFIFALGTGTFSLLGAVKLSAYIAVPTLLLMPDRLHRAERVGWRDFAAMVALAVPVSAHWLVGVWAWPQEIYFFRPLFCVCVGAYGFMVIRNLDGIGYRIGLRKEDVITGLANFAVFSLLAVPLGLVLGFLHPHTTPAIASELALRPFGASFTISIPGWLNLAFNFLMRFFGIYFSIAIPEELMFRGILQNFLVKSISRGPRALYGLLIASVVFGAAHLHHPPVPNWRYGILATLAGILYGNAYLTRQRLSASALTHSLVDTAWHFWF